MRTVKTSRSAPSFPALPSGGDSSTTGAAASPGGPVMIGAVLRQWVRGYLGARVRNDALADDLTQDVLIRAAAQAHTLRNPAALPGWIRRIADNCATDHFRRSPSLTEWREEHAEVDATPGVPDAFAAEERALREQLHAYIRSVVERLPDAQREALLLSEVEGISQVELARRLGISVTAAKSRVQRARAELRRNLESCCRFETDCYGRVVDVTPRPGAK